MYVTNRQFSDKFNNGLKNNWPIYCDSFHFYPLPNEVGAGGIGVASDVRFQVGICSENFQLDQIQNGRLSAIINFNMPDTGQTVPDS